MSNLEHNSLVFRIEQLEQQYQVLAEYITSTKRQLDRLHEQIDNQPVLEQLAELEQLLNNPLVLPQTPVEVVNLQTEASSAIEQSQPQPKQLQVYEYQLVFDRVGSRAVLMEALELAQKRLIIVCPWLNRNSIDADLIQKFRKCLNRNCRIDIGWGHLSDRSRIGIGWRYNALPELRQIEQDYPNLFSLKLLGTHEKFLVCGSTFAMLGSHNMLTSSTQSAEREVGIRTTDPLIIQGLIERFENAHVADSQTTNDEWIEDSASLDDDEVLELQVLSKPENTYLIDIDAEVITLEMDDVSKTLKGAISVEELLKRYKAGERDFAEINLANANLSGISLEGVNLSKANLAQANLTQIKLGNSNLSGAKLNGADLSGAKLSYTNFMNADLTCTDLSAANLSSAKLTGANLSNAKLIQTNLTNADLARASLSYANLTAASLSYATLTSACLKGANLLAADLEGTNLRKTAFDVKTKLNGAKLRFTNLAGQDLQKLNLSGIDLTDANLCGAWLCFSNLSGANLSSTDLRGADLGYTSLEKANLKNANLTGASLEGAKLNGAIMPNGAVHD